MNTIEDNPTIDVIEINGKAYSLQEFEIEKKKLQEKKMKLVEIGKNKYVTRLLD
jgi:hypothetical protein